MSVAERLIPSWIAAVIVATVPIWLNVGEAILTRRRPSLLAIGGLLVGLVGVAILLLPAQGIDAINPPGIGIVLCSALSWSARVAYARRAPLPANQLMGSGMEQLVGGGVMLAVAGCWANSPRRSPDRSPSSRCSASPTSSSSAR